MGAAFWRQTLTATEAAALQLLANGYAVKQAAGQLSLRVSALEYQLRTARGKLDARNTTHAVAIALRRGLIAPPVRGQSRTYVRGQSFAR